MQDQRPFLKFIAAAAHGGSFCSEAEIQLRIDRGETSRMGRWYRIERTFLGFADALRDETMMKDDAALTAMILLIQDQMERLGHRKCSPYDAQLLAWLMGESMDRLRPEASAADQRAAYYPDERPWAAAIDLLIGQARQRPAGEPMPEPLIRSVQSRATFLRAQRKHLQGHVTDQSRQMAALLPDAETLDRLIRYESHAERGLKRSLAMLAQLRGVTIESIAATITTSDPPGTTTQLHRQRTHRKAME